MPYINVKVVGKLDKKQKQKIAAQFSQILEDVAGKPKEHTYTVIDEVDAANWAKGDQLLG